MTFLFLRMMTIVNWCYSEGKIFFGKVFTALGNHMYFWQCLQTSLVGTVYASLGKIARKNSSLSSSNSKVS